MKPTYEQVVEWAREAGMREGDVGDWTTADAALMYPECVYTENLERFAALAYEAGRKDENEACAEACERAVGSASMYQDRDAAIFAYGIKNHCQKLIRARREQ